jgi:type II secretory pathway pseudopilin PulG
MLVEAMVALVVLGLAAAALIGLLLTATGGARSAAVEGRRAELAQRAGDLARTGQASGAAGTIRRTIGGEVYEAVYARRDDVSPGALEVTVTRLDGGGSLTLSPASSVLVPAEP